MKTMYKRPIAFLLFIAMLLTMLPGVALAGSADLVDPDDTVAESVIEPAGEAEIAPAAGGVWTGLGTAASPFLIEDADDLWALSTAVNAGSTYSGSYFEVTNDIEVSDWVPIGSSGTITSSTYCFAGNFDGAGHVITVNGLKASSYVGSGLFGVLRGKVYNVILDGYIATDASTNYTGGFAGVTQTGAVIANCVNRMTIDGKATGSYTTAYVGGFVGYMYTSANALITNCYNEGEVNSDEYGGGIVGFGMTGAGTVQYSINAGTVTSLTGNTNGVHGINSAGNFWPVVVDCYNLDDLAAGEISQATLDTWNASSAGYTDVEFWTLDEDGYPTYTLSAESEAPAPEAPWAGDGTAESPYQIADREGLEALSEAVNAGDAELSAASYILVNDIELGDQGWTPIGSSAELAFTGSFNGAGHTVSGLSITDAEISGINVAGLFGYARDAAFSNLTVSGKIELTTGNITVGSLVAYGDGITVENCLNLADINNYSYSGGLVGHASNGITVESSANVGNVISQRGTATGGLVGLVTSGGPMTIRNSYNAGTVGGYEDTAGIAASINVPSSGSVIENCFNVGYIYSAYGRANDEARYTNHIYNSWDRDDDNAVHNFAEEGKVKSSRDESLGVEALLSAEEIRALYPELNDYAGAELFVEGPDYPLLYWQVEGEEPEPEPGDEADVWDGSISDGLVGAGIAAAPYRIYSGADLAYLAQEVNSGNTAMSRAYYILMNDIDLNDLAWTAIGVGYDTDEDRPFTGHFDGDGYAITGLNVKAAYPGTGTTWDKGDNVGLFRYVKDATIKNLSIAGEAKGTGTSGDHTMVGGLVGYSAGVTIENVANYVNVSDAYYAGGIVGYSGEDGVLTIRNSYNAGTITGIDQAAGIIAESTYNVGEGSLIENCFNYGSISCTESTTYYNIYAYLGNNTTAVHNYALTGAAAGSANENRGANLITADAMRNSLAGALNDYAGEEIFVNGDEHPLFVWEVYREEEPGDAETPAFTIDLEEVIVDQGDDLTLTVEAVVFDGGTVTYQWYRNTSYSNEGGTAIDGETGNTYTPDTSEVGAYYYYVVATNTNPAASGATTASATSAVARVRVEEFSGYNDWDGTYDTSWYDADLDEFYIYTFSQLASIGSVDLEGKTVYLANNLTMDPDSGRDWTPINGLNGTFNGQGHTVTIYIDRPNQNYQGLFGQITDENAVVRNVIVRGSIVGGSDVGGIVGYMSAGTVEYSGNKASVTGGNSNVASINSSESRVGGIVGYLYAGEVLGCYNRGYITTTADQDHSWMVGGIAGSTGGTSSAVSIASSYNTGTIDGLGKDSYTYIGGIAGFFGNESNLSRCYNVGDILCESAYGGGIVGSANGYYLQNGYNYYLEGTAPSGNGRDADEATSYVAVTAEQLMNPGEVLSYLASAYALDEYDYNDGFFILGWELDLDFEIPKITELGSKYDLLEFMANVRGGYDYADQTVTILNDIDLEGDLETGENPWAAVGSVANPFAGTFDGQGYTVYNVLLLNNSSGAQGFFAANAGTIKNLTVTGWAWSQQNDAFGGIVGRNVGTVENCVSYMDLSQIYNSSYVGGIVGDNAGTVIDCVNYGDVGFQSPANYNEKVGGIVGRMEPIGLNNVYLDVRPLVENCVNHGTVYGTQYVGGVVGANFNDEGPAGNILNCGNTGDVYAPSYSYYGGSYVGGVVGNINAVSGNETVIYVANCYNTGTIHGSTAMYVGGLVGQVWLQEAIIENSYNAGDIEHSGGNDASYYVGSLVGRNRATVYNSYIKNGTGSVTGYGGSDMRYQILTPETMLGNWFAELLGDAYKVNAKDSYPVLAFEEQDDANMVTVTFGSIGTDEKLTRSVASGETITLPSAVFSNPGQVQYWFAGTGLYLPATEITVTEDTDALAFFTGLVLKNIYPVEVADDVDGIWTLGISHTSAIEGTTVGVDVTRLDSAYTSELTGITLGDTVYPVSEATNVIYDDYGAVRGGSFTVVTSADYNSLYVDYEAEGFTIIYDGGRYDMTLDQVIEIAEELGTYDTDRVYYSAYTVWNDEEKEHYSGEEILTVEGVTDSYITLDALFEYLEIDYLSHDEITFTSPYNTHYDDGRTFTETMTIDELFNEDRFSYVDGNTVEFAPLLTLKAFQQTRYIGFDESMITEAVTDTERTVRVVAGLSQDDVDDDDIKIKTNNRNVSWVTVIELTK